MTTEIIYTGGIDNWMDFRDLLIKNLQSCDTDIKLTKLITGIIVSFCPTAQSINDIREEMGIKKLGKAELNKLDKIMKAGKKE